MARRDGVSLGRRLRKPVGDSDSEDVAHPYLGAWLSAFEAARDRGKSLIDRFSARMVQELHLNLDEFRAKQGEAPNKTKVRETEAGAYKLTAVGAVGLLAAMWRQRKALKRVFGSLGGGPTGLVAISTKRLPLANSLSPRRRLSTLARALPGAADPERIGNAIQICRNVLVFEPHSISSLWANRDTCWDDGVYIVDYMFLFFTLIAEPLKTLRGVWECRHDIREAITQRGGGKLKPVVVGILLDVSYGTLLGRAESLHGYFFTSNSFATEVLRAFLLRATACREICEMLHGVPTLELEEYFTALLSSSQLRSKQRFVSQIPYLPLYGAYVMSDSREPEFAVNTAVNRRLLDWNARGPELLERIEGEWARLAAGPGVSRPLVVAITGATAHESDYVRSSVFAVEQAIIRHVRETLLDAGYPFVLWYTPHPAHAEAIFSNSLFFNGQGVVICRDTMFTWLVADLCVALYSSALFEAAFSGVKVFTPIRYDDLIYPPILLDRLTHPGPDEGCLDALSAFLLSNARPSDEDVTIRARRRLSRFADSGSPTGSGSSEAVWRFRHPLTKGEMAR